MGSARHWPRNDACHAAGIRPSEQRCLTCHAPNGSARQAALVRHPEVPAGLLARAGAKSPAPPATQPGQPGLPEGADHITCITCHTPHGRSENERRKAPAGATAAQVHASKPLLRPNISREVCASCHGFESIRRLLYWHQPAKRAPR